MIPQPLQFWVALTLSVLATAGAIPGNGLLALASAPDYYLLKAYGKTIGQLQIQNHAVASNGPNTVTEIRNTSHFTRDGSPFDLYAVSRFVENPVNGQPLSFTYQYNLGEERLMEAQGQLQGNQLDLRMVNDNTETSGQAPVESGQFLFPGGPGMEKVYQAHYHDAPGSTFQFQTLNLGIKPALVHSEVTPMGREKLALASGKKQAVRKFEIKNPANKTSKVYEWRNAQGKLYRAKSVGEEGMELMYASRRQVRQADEDTLDLVTTTAVVSNIIPQARITNEALYRISPINGQSIAWQSAFPESYTQEIVRGGVNTLLQGTASENSLYLKILQKEPSDAAAPYPVSFDPQYLQSTPYLQATDPDVERIALEVVGLNPSQREQRSYFAARKLRQWVYENIANKDLSLGFASAKETLHNRKGDCTEHAVLLAALSRSLGIPSRVAVGLIYIPQGDSNLGRFVYHMWTEVYIGNRDQGEWIPLDATTPEAKVDATHIKMADSPLTDMNDLMNLTQKALGLMGKMKIDVIKALSPSQSTLIVGKQSGGVMDVEMPELDIQRIDIRTLSAKAIQHFRVALPPSALSTETADGLFTYGVEALSKGNYDRAQGFFNKALTKLRRPVEFYRMGEKLAGLEYYALARQAFEAAQNRDARFGPLVNAWFKVYFPDTTLPESENRQFMLASSPQQNSASSVLSAPDSTTLLKAIITEANGFAPAYRKLGESTTGAEALQSLRQAIAMNPQNFRNHESLGDALMTQGQYIAAAQAYREACKTLEGSPLAQSTSWLDDAKGKLALATGASMLGKSQRNAAAWLSIGKGLMLQNRPEEATQAFNNARILGNSSARLYVFSMALKNDDWKTLFKHQGQVAAMAGNSAMAAQLLGHYQLRTRQYNPAVNTLKRSIQMAPHHAVGYLKLSQAYLRLAEQSSGSGKPAQAEVKRNRYRSLANATLRQGLAAVHSIPERDRLTLSLARLLLDDNKPDEAKALAEGALNRNPVDGTAYYTMGKAQFYAGDYVSARESLSDALILNPNDAPTLLQLGHVAMEEGRDSLALDYYQKASRADALNAEAAKSFNALKASLQIAGKKIPDYWYLSDDEHDYLVQMVYQIKQSKLNTRQYLNALLALPGTPGEVEFSTRGVSAIEGSRGRFEQLHGLAVDAYNRLQDQSVPPRLSAMHYRVSMASINYVHLLEQTPETYLTFNASRNTLKALPVITQGIAQNQQAITQEITMLATKLPDAAFKQLAYEAQAADLLDLDTEINTLTAQLAGKFQKAQAQAKPKTPAMPPGAMALPQASGTPQNSMMPPTANPPVAATTKP